VELEHALNSIPVETVGSGLAGKTPTFRAREQDMEQRSAISERRFDSPRI
jgi:hypothetical protein